MHRILLYILFTTSLFAKDIIAVLDLETVGLTPEEAQILTQGLTTKLIALDKFQVVERTNMDKILKEQKFQHSGCTDSGCAVEIGQLLNTDYIVIGSVNKFGSTYALYARLIDVGQGKSQISAEFSMEGKIDGLITTGITSIAKQLCGLLHQETGQYKQTYVHPGSKLGLHSSNLIKRKPNLLVPSISGAIFLIAALQNNSNYQYCVDNDCFDGTEFTDPNRATINNISIMTMITSAIVISVYFILENKKPKYIPNPYINEPDKDKESHSLLFYKHNTIAVFDKT